MEGYDRLPVRLSPTVIKQVATDGCPPQMAVEDQLDETKEEIKQRINDTVLSCGGIGWTRIAYLDMRDPGSVCPTNWTLHTSPRSCGRTSRNRFTCDSEMISVKGQRYSRVCGKILAYQKGSTDAFWNAISHSKTTIDSAYVDGLSLTHGPVGSRQHIWTFSTALYGQDPGFDTLHNCACSNTRRDWNYKLPSFIQNNYFCDTGNPGPGWSSTTFFTANPLWDGAGCDKDSTCCQFNSPPWFYSSLPQATTDDLEVRICNGEGIDDEDTRVYMMEINAQLVE